MAKKIQIEIPEDEKGTFLAIAQAPEKDIEKLRLALMAAEPSLVRREFVRRIASLSRKYEALNADSVVQALINMVASAVNANITIPAVCAGTAEHIYPDSRAQGKRRVLQDRLTSLASTRSIKAIGKSINLTHFQSKSYRKAKITSQFLPIFNDTKGEYQIDAGLVSHQLRIVTFDNEDETTTSFNVSMDIEDLHELLAQVKRAIEKDRSLRAFFEAAGKPIMTPKHSADGDLDEL